MGYTYATLISGPFYDEMKAKYPGTNAYNKMPAFSAVNPNTNVTLVTPGGSMAAMRVGKHKGKQLQDVDVDYLRWAAREACTMFDRQQLKWIQHHVIENRGTRHEPLAIRDSLRKL